MRIDRLVLDIPGLDPAQGVRSRRASPKAWPRPALQASTRSVSVPLASGNMPPDDLAARIVAALMQRLV